MFEILMYLYENYMNDGVKINADLTTVVTQLESMGFYDDDINQALNWLQGLKDIQALVEGGAPTALALRHFSPEESQRLGKKGKAFLQQLEQLNILDPMTREIVLDRIVALYPHQVDMGRIKWVVLIVLFNQPSKKQALTLLQDMILSEAHRVLH